MRIRVKICGITRPEWAVAAAEAGADAIGLVFADSPRCVKVAEATRIIQALPPWVAPVGVFVDDDPMRVRALAAVQGRNYVIPDDIKALAAPVLAHRLVVKTETGLRGQSAETIVQAVLASTPVPVEEVSK